MSNLKVHYSSKSQDWETPKPLFDYFNKDYQFELDTAATKENTLCQNYFTKEQNALIQDWSIYKSSWTNPPYNREGRLFIKKAYEESLKNHIAIMLLPCRTDVKVWHDYVMKSSFIYFIKGRLKFVNKSLPSYQENGNFRLNSAPFPSCIVIFDCRFKNNKPEIFSLDQKEFLNA